MKTVAIGLEASNQPDAQPQEIKFIKTDRNSRRYQTRMKCGCNVSGLAQERQKQVFDAHLHVSGLLLQDEIGDLFRNLQRKKGGEKVSQSSFLLLKTKQEEPPVTSSSAFKNTPW